MNQPNTPEKMKKTPLYAWMGEDEYTGEVGLKQGIVPAGFIPLVAVNGQKIDRDFIIAQLQIQANTYGKPIRFCKYEFVEELITIIPDTLK